MNRHREILRTVNRVWAIAWISIRNAIRSKLVAALLCGVVLVLVGLPLTIKGDGTLTGQVRLLIQYSLGLATLILSLGTVWAACAAISTEIRDRHIQMVLSKPIHAAQCWLGKWLGLAILSGAFLLCCVAGTYIAVQSTIRSDQWSATEREQLRLDVLSAQQPIPPRPLQLDDAIARRYQAGTARGEWPDDMPAEQILLELERLTLAQANAVRPDSTRQWIFDIADKPPADQPLVLRYRFTTSTIDLETIHGTWHIGSADQSERYTVSIESTQRTWQHIVIPVDYIDDNGTLVAEFVNTHERPVTVLFTPETELQLMVYQGGFLGNMARAALLLFIHLSFLAAIGLTAGAFFSVPVAAMTSFYALLILYAGQFVQRLAERDLEAAHVSAQSGLDEWVLNLSHWIYGGIHLLIRPIHGTNPLDILANGEWISWGLVSYMFGLKGIVYSGVLMLLGAWHLSRKEVALPA